jgi:hypothetical protein
MPIRVIDKSEAAPVEINVPDAPLVLTKIEGATRQTDAAIDALFRGDFDIAITLAGAAEGMIERDGPHLWTFLSDLKKVRERIAILEGGQTEPVERKAWISTLNSGRDWLKHSAGGETLTNDRVPAAIMISRAASKLEKWTPRMEQFKAWLMVNFEDVLA